MSITERNSEHKHERISDDNSFALAVAVIRERIERLSDNDKQDLYDVFPYLLNDDAEERQSAQVAVNEILDQECFVIQEMELPNDPGQELEKWVQYVSKKIRETRKKMNMTQAELAKAANIPQSHVSRLERGEHSPTAKTLRKLADALNVEPKTFDPCAENE